MTDLQKWKYFESYKAHEIEDLVRHPKTKQIIVMKSSAVGKTTYIPELFKKRIEEKRDEV